MYKNRAKVAYIYKKNRKFYARYRPYKKAGAIAPTD
jgi:hypothetical protein